MSSTDELRRLLDERGVEYEGGERSLRWRDRYGVMMQAFPLANGELGMGVWSCTPEQAIAATLGDSDATGARRGVAGKVYLVEACDELIEGWCPLGVYLSREAAGKHAESLRGEVDGVMSFARVVEMEVLG